MQLEKNEENLAAEAQKFCNDSALSLNDYWNNYEQYNVIRMLIDENVFKHFLSENNYEEDYDIAVLSTDITTAYFAEIDNLVDKAEIVYL